MILLVGLLAALAVPFLAPDDLARSEIRRRLGRHHLARHCPRPPPRAAGGSKHQGGRWLVRDHDHRGAGARPAGARPPLRDPDRKDRRSAESRRPTPLGMVDQVQAFLEAGEAEFQARRSSPAQGGLMSASPDGAAQISGKTSVPDPADRPPPDGLLAGARQPVRGSVRIPAWLVAPAGTWTSRTRLRALGVARGAAEPRQPEARDGPGRLLPRRPDDAGAVGALGRR